MAPNYARLLLDASGNLGSAVNALVIESQAPNTAPRYERDAEGLLINAPELDALGYDPAKVKFGTVFKDDLPKLNQLQKYNLGPMCGYDFRSNVWAPAFGQFKEGEKIGWMAPTRYGIGPVDGLTGALTAVNLGDFPLTVLGTHELNSYDDFLSELAANPIDFSTREGGPVADGSGKRGKKA